MHFIEFTDFISIILLYTPLYSIILTMVSLGSPSDSEASDYAEEIQGFRQRLETQLQHDSNQHSPPMLDDSIPSEDCLSDGSPAPENFRLYYGSDKLEIPKGLEEVQDMSSIINKKIFDLLPPEDQKHLLQFLPSGAKESSEEIIEKLWDEEANYFRAMHPLKLFKEMLDSDYFSEVSTSIHL